MSISKLKPDIKNQILVNKESLPSDLNRFKSSLPIFSLGDVDLQNESTIESEDSNDESESKPCSKSKSGSPKGGYTTTPIRFNKDLKHQQVGASKKLLMQKLINMGILTKKEEYPQVR